MSNSIGKTARITALAFILAAIILPAAGFSQDVFQFSAPPGAVYLNSSFEQNSTELISITVEHKGAGHF